jgi:hypothetical protein
LPAEPDPAELAVRIAPFGDLAWDDTPLEVFEKLQKYALETVRVVVRSVRAMEPSVFQRGLAQEHAKDLTQMEGLGKPVVDRDVKFRAYPIFVAGVPCEVSVRLQPYAALVLRSRQQVAVLRPGGNRDYYAPWVLTRISLSGEGVPLETATALHGNIKQKYVSFARQSVAYRAVRDCDLDRRLAMRTLASPNVRTYVHQLVVCLESPHEQVRLRQLREASRQSQGFLSRAEQEMVDSLNDVAESCVSTGNLYGGEQRLDQGWVDAEGNSFQSRLVGADAGRLTSSGGTAGRIEVSYARSGEYLRLLQQELEEHQNQMQLENVMQQRARQNPARIDYSREL